MRIYIVATVLDLTEPETLSMKNGNKFQRATAIVRTKDEMDDSYLAVDVCGEDRIQKLIEAKTSGQPQEMVVTIATRRIEKDNGKVSYLTYFNLKYLLGSIR